MQPRPKVWIPTIIAIFVVAILLGFAPIRRSQQEGFDVDSSFGFSFAKPLVTSASMTEDKQNEIRQVQIGRAHV